MTWTVSEIAAVVAILFSMGTPAWSIFRRAVGGSFAKATDLRSLETTMTTTHIGHSMRIKDVEHGHSLLEERIQHLPAREQFDELKESLGELRTENATIIAKMEEMPRLREAIDGLTKEIRDSRRA